MALHQETFQYLKPTDGQLKDMEALRKLFRVFAAEIEAILPEGPDKTYVLRQLRDIAMWSNLCVTRHPDGAPRT